MKVFEYFSEFPSLSNYKMTDESRQLAEENYRLFLFMFNRYKNKYRNTIDGDDFEEHIDIFYLCYCKQCHVYVMKQEDKHKLSTYLDKAFKSICEHALRHCKTDYIQQWRNRTMPLDKMTDTGTHIGEFIADERINISEQCETAEMLNNILTYVDNQIQTTKKNTLHFNCSGWLVFKEWHTNSFANTTQFLDYLKNEGLAAEDTTEIHIHKVLSYYRRKLKEALERGEV